MTTARHAAPCRSRSWIIVAAVVLALAVSLLAGLAARHSGQPPAQATLASATETTGGRLLDKAETRAGDWYAYGTAGPFTFDCSGLVYWSATAIGERNWPRDTYDLIAAVVGGRLSYTSHPVRGDLAFYGPGHVEIMTAWYHTTFGAQHTGTRVGWHRWSTYWHPTFFLHVNW